MNQSTSTGQRLLMLITLLLPLLLGSSNQSILKDNDNFYLSNYTTFSPGSRVSVNLYNYSRNGGTYNFRLLLIEDPVSFFSSIDKNNMRYSFDIFGGRKEVLLKYTSVVKEWKDYIPSKYYGSNNNLPIGRIDKPGIYILQAIKGDRVAYCGIVVSDLSLVFKNSGRQILAYVANAKTSEFLLKSRISVYSAGKLVTSQTSDKDGIVLIDMDKLKSDNITAPILIAQAGEETILSDPYYYFRNGTNKYYTAYIYTNQPVYRPGQQVFFKAVMREKGGNEIKNVPYEKFSVTIKSSKNKEVFSSDLTTNEFGSLNSDFTLDDEADLGDYSILVSNGNNTYYGSFSVEEYKKPEYKVEVNTGSKNYAAKDIIDGKVTADYYFGSPVTNGEVTLNIYKKQYWRPWWYWSEYSWFYRSYSKRMYYGNQQLVSQETGSLDDKGEYQFSYKVDDDVQYDYVYVITAEVKDASRRVISGSSEVYVTRGAFSIFTSPDRYFVERGKTVNLRVNANDFSDNPVQTDFDIIINYSNPRMHYNQDRLEVLHGTTDSHGKASVPYPTSRLNEGHYTYTVKAFDGKGREITASSSFYVGDVNNYYYGRTGSGLEIVTDKDAYDKGDSLIAYIFIPTTNTNLLLTYESDIFIKYKKYYVEGNSLTIREKLTDKFSPSFNIAVCYLKDRQFYNTSKLVGVLAKDKFLDISLKPSKEIYKPGEMADYLVTVKDYKGNPVPNTDMSFGIIDESIYAIKEDQTQDIQSFFYAPTYSYIPTYSSLQYSNFSSHSRDITYIDKNFFKDENRNDKNLKKGSLYGKVRIKDSDKSAKNIYVILTSEKYYYTVETDTNGYYKIGNIVHGEYDLYISGNGHNLTLIKKVNINKKSTEFNFDIEKASEITNTQGDIAMEETDFAVQPGVVTQNAIRGGRADGMMMKAEMKDKSTAYVKAEVRSNFLDALIWKADIITDKNGTAKVSFKIPDNLTTWRTTVRGVTKSTDVGQQTDKIISRKDLLVRMETPRFFREGDELTVSTIVHNYLDENKKTKISFTADNVELIGSEVNSKGYDPEMNKSKNGVYEIIIDKNGELRIDWTVKVNNPMGEAKLTAEALTNEESDALELKVPIMPQGIRVTNPLVSDFNDFSKTEELSFRIPGDVDLRTAKLEFDLSPSLAGTIIKALDDLVGYPYGCVEQTMSRFLPTIIVANTFKDIDAPLKYSTIEELPKMVEAGLKRLYNFQHADGGWGWWTNDKTHPYMTAYVIYGMTLAKNAGYPVDGGIYFRGVENLKQQIEKSESLDETTVSFMLYSMATALKYSSADYSDLNKRIEKLLDDDLNAYSIALLTIALKDINNNSLARAASEKLERMVHSEDRFAYWGGKEWHYSWQDDKVQTTAFVLKALLKTNANTELIGKTVRWLLQQKQGFSWRSTQETAAVIFALADYLKTTNELNPDYNVTIYVNGEQVANRHFTKADIYKETKTFSFSGLKDNILHKGDNEIKIVKNGSGKLYFSGINQYYTKDENAAAKTGSFKVKREYFILKPEQMKDRIIYTKERFNGTVVSGENILVKTYVDTRDNDLQYFILEDMLPSGFEVVKEEQNFEIEGENNYKYYDYWDYRPWRWFYADREYRDEKVAFFVTNVNNDMQFSYIIKAQMPGQYEVPAAQAYLMYYPEVGGNSQVLNITVND